jgi:hypothetical protein
MKCLKCKQDTIPVYRKVGPHFGTYCKYCGSFIKWAKKGSVGVVEEIETKKLF